MKVRKILLESSRVKYLMPFIISLMLFSPILANNKLDSDNDGVPDVDEISIYHTDPYNPDTDGDGYKDWYEINQGFSPLNPQPLKSDKVDSDKDGLSDYKEFEFQTDALNPDTDGDGFKDGDEIKAKYDPLNKSKIKLAKRIEINLNNQELSYYLGQYRMATTKISSGKGGTTPKGNFKIQNKSLKAWSPYGLWMPYWLGINGQNFGIHELPIWPNGYREGSNHLGTPVSHGCIRLGIGPAKELYNWAEIGTAVKIY